MRKALLLGLTLVLVGFAASPAVWATEGVGAGSTFQFGVDARALGMGGAFVAVANSYSATYWNPAGLALLSKTTIGGMNTNKFGQGINFNFASAATNLGFLAVGGTFIGSTISGIETFDAQGNPGATVDDNEMLVGGSAAMALPLGGLSALAGASGKYYIHDLAGEHGSGLGFDAGLMLKVSDNLSVGAAASDLGGSKITWSTGAVDMVSMNSRVGAALTLVQPVPWTVAAQFDVESSTIHVGAEFRPTEQIAIRVGAMKPSEGDFSLTAGAGLMLGSISVDAAFVQNKLLGNSIVLSGSFGF
jgi:hypothetical protein